MSRQELAEIDSQFGSARYGPTMVKIAKAVALTVEQPEGGLCLILTKLLGAKSKKLTNF